MDTIVCNGVSINYRCVGEGRDVVLIHGLAANHAFWHVNVLLPLARDCRVTVYDLRGHGYSSMPPSGYTSTDMGEDLHHLLNHLGIPNAHLVGHSFGGVVALHYAVLHPERVSSLTIADSRVCALQPHNCPRDWPNWRTTKKRLEKLELFLPDDEAEPGLWLLEQLASPEWQQKRHKLEGSPLFIPFSKWGGGNRSAERWLELLQTTTARQDLTSSAGLTLDKLSNIQHPTLAIYGETSPLMPSFQGLRDHLPNCKASFIPAAGHFYPLTQPKFFVTMVSQFLEEIAPKDRRKHKRFSLRFPVDLRENTSACYPAVTLDISKRGLLIESYRELEVGTEVEVIATLNQNARMIALRGKVVRMVRTETGNDYLVGIELFPEGDWHKAWENFLAT